MGKFKELANLLAEPTSELDFTSESVLENQIVSQGIVPQLIPLKKLNVHPSNPVSFLTQRKLPE